MAPSCLLPRCLSELFSCSLSFLPCWGLRSRCHQLPGNAAEGVLAPGIRSQLFNKALRGTRLPWLGAPGKAARPRASREQPLDFGRGVPFSFVSPRSSVLNHPSASFAFALPLPFLALGMEPSTGILRGGHGLGALEDSQWDLHRLHGDLVASLCLCPLRGDAPRFTAWHGAGFAAGR